MAEDGGNKTHAAYDRIIYGDKIKMINTRQDKMMKSKKQVTDLFFCPVSQSSPIYLKLIYLRRVYLQSVIVSSDIAAHSSQPPE